MDSLKVAMKRRVINTLVTVAWAFIILASIDSVVFYICNKLEDSGYIKDNPVLAVHLLLLVVAGASVLTIFNDKETKANILRFLDINDFTDRTIIHFTLCIVMLVATVLTGCFELETVCTICAFMFLALLFSLIAIVCPEQNKDDKREIK